MLRRGSDWKMVAGFALVLAMLALSTPGVRVVHADDAVAEVTAVDARPGPSCQAGSIAKPSTVVIELPRIAAEAQDPDSIPIALNTAGYNYGSGPAQRPAARR